MCRGTKREGDGYREGGGYRGKSRGTEHILFMYINLECAGVGIW